MRKHHLLFPMLLMYVMFVGLETAKAQNPTPTPTPSIAEGFYFNDSVAGQTITIPGTFTDLISGTALLKAIGTGRSREGEVKISEDKNSLSFTLPNDIESGRYKVRLTLSSKNGALPPLEMPTELRIPPPPALTVTVAKVLPDPDPYPNAKNPKAKDGKSYDFVIAGTNFSRDLKNNHVEINAVPIPDLKYADSNNKCVNGFPCLRTESNNETRKLIVEGYAPPGFNHPLEVAVRVGDADNVAKAADPLIFSRVSKGRLRIYAVGAFLALVAILFALVQAGIKLRRASDATFNSLRAFLIDKDTNSYSLSKFQLMLFTLVTIFGYIYVFVCQLFVQWKFELPPVPDGLPTMMGVSVGTSVVAAGIGARIGGKGAGAESPSLADFITSGGVVLPERFQFFLWTIVSSMGVLVLILASDPVTLSQLPKLPDGMLYLMGLSSAGYLGGKLVRGAGPNIKSIDVSRADVAAQGDEAAYVAVEATLTGDNLSPKATFQLDDEKIPADQVKIIEQKDDADHPEFCRMLKVHLKDVAQRFFDEPHVLRILNPDGQGAEITYGAKITSATKVEQQAADTRIIISVKGSGFKDPSRAAWKPADAAPEAESTLIPEADITKKSDTEIEVTLPEGAVPPGKLTIISPGGLASTVDVT